MSSWFPFGSLPRRPKRHSRGSKTSPRASQRLQEAPKSPPGGSKKASRDPKSRSRELYKSKDALLRSPATECKTGMPKNETTGVGQETSQPSLIALQRVQKYECESAFTLAAGSSIYSCNKIAAVCWIRSIECCLYVRGNSCALSECLIDVISLNSFLSCTPTYFWFGGFGRYVQL